MYDFCLSARMLCEKTPQWLSLPRKGGTADILIELKLLRSIEEILVAEKEHAFHMKIELVVVGILRKCRD